jgi:ABC-type phosphate transport system permease subunit
MLADALLVGLFAGAVCGIAPLVLAIKRGRDPYGIGALVACSLAGAILGLLLALPVAGIACALILATRTD